MVKDTLVTKRNGDKEPLDLEKLHKVIFYACDDITVVSPSQVEINSHRSFFNGILTQLLQDFPTLLNQCLEKYISIRTCMSLG